MKLSMISLSLSMAFLSSFSIFCSQNSEYQILGQVGRLHKFEVKIPTYSQNSGRAHACMRLLIDRDTYDRIIKFIDAHKTEQTLFPIGIVASFEGKKNYRVDWVSLVESKEKKRIALQKEKELENEFFQKKKQLFLGGRKL